MTLNRTPRLGLALPNFDQAPWHDDVNDNMRMIDAIIYSALGVSNFRGVFQNSLEVTLGDRYFDPISGEIFQVLTTYVTSAAPTTFAEERAAFPSYWLSVNEAVLSALTDAQAAALLAQDWAVKADGPVTPGPAPLFSAKWYAKAAQEFAQNTNDDLAAVGVIRDTIVVKATEVSDDKDIVVAAVASIADAKITWQGPWVTASSYAFRDAVVRNGTSYIAKTAHTSGPANEPGSGADWATVWDILALKGDQGDVGPAGPGTGDVVGPTGAINNRIAIFDGTTGKLLKDGGVAVDGIATAAQGAKADTAMQPGDDLPWSDLTGVPASFPPAAHAHLASEITDFNTAVAGNSAVAANTAKVSNATHTGDVTGATTLTIANDAVNNAKLANMPSARIKGRVLGGGTGDPQDLIPSEVRTILNVEEGATANASDAELRDRSTHTGEQAQSTVTGLEDALAARQVWPFLSRATAIAATIAVDVPIVRVIFNGMVLDYERKPGSTALTTNGGTVAWGPAAGKQAYYEHWGITTRRVNGSELSFEAPVVTVGTIMAGQPDQSALVNAVHAEHIGDVQLTGFIRVSSQITFNWNCVIKGVEGKREVAGFAILSDFNMSVNHCIATAPGEPGTPFSGFTIYFDQPTNPASRNDLIRYPWAIEAGKAARTTFENLRIIGAINGIDMRGASAAGGPNPGGNYLTNLELMCYGESVLINNALDYVMVTGYRSWPFQSAGFAGQMAIFTDGRSTAMRVEKCDGFFASPITTWQTRVAFGRRAGVHLKLTGDVAWPAEGQTVTQAGSGATGVVDYIIAGPRTEVRLVNVTGTFNTTGQLSGSGGSWGAASVPTSVEIFAAIPNTDITYYGTIKLDGPGGSALYLDGGKSCFQVYSTKIETADTIFIRGGSHQIVPDVRSAKPDAILVTAGDVAFHGGKLESQLVTNSMLRVTGGRATVHGTFLKWPNTASSVPFLRQEGPGQLIVEGASTDQMLLARPVVEFATDNLFNRIDNNMFAPNLTATFNAAWTLGWYRHGGVTSPKARTQDSLIIDNGLADGGEVEFRSAGNPQWSVDNLSGQLRFIRDGVARIGLTDTTASINLQVTGTAVTQSDVDTTAGRLLSMRSTGVFGLGSTTSSPNCPDLNLRTLAAGVYNVISGTVNADTRPVGSSEFATVEVFRYNNQITWQIYNDRTDATGLGVRRWIRGSNASGVWGPWKRFMLSDDVMQSVHDTTAGRLLTQGAYGWGQTGATQTNRTLATANTSGVHQFAPDDPDRPIATGGSVLVIRYAGSWISQIVFGASVTQMWLRRSENNGSTWSPWVPVTGVSGSNANGTWSRKADGTMECEHTQNSSSAGAATWTFPTDVPFIAAPNIQVTPGSTVFRTATQASTGTPTLTVDFRCFDSAGALTVTGCNLFAKGRWY